MQPLIKLQEFSFISAIMMLIICRWASWVLCISLGRYVIISD